MPAVNSPRRRVARDFGALAVGESIRELVPHGANPADLLGGMRHSLNRWRERTGDYTSGFEVGVWQRIGSTPRVYAKRLTAGKSKRAAA